MKCIRKILGVGILTVLAVMSLASCQSSQNAENSAATQDKNEIILKAASQTDYPPFCYIDENGKHTGFDVELLQTISDRLDGYTIDIAGGGWDSMFLSIDSHRLDLIADEVAITEEREEKYIFSEPYIEIFSSIAVKKGRDDIHSLDDLVGKHVVTTVDSYSALLEEYNATHDGQIIIDYVSEVSELDMLTDLARGKYDAHVNDPITMGEVIKENNIDAEVLDEPLTREPAAIVFTKTADGQKLKELIDPVIKELKADGTLSELSKKWTGNDYIPE